MTHILYQHRFDQQVLVVSILHFYEHQTMKESPLGDVQKVDVGIALCHFDMSMEEAGIAGEFVFEEPEIKAPEGVHYIVTYILPH